MFLVLVGVVVVIAASWVYGPAVDLWTTRAVTELVSGLGSAAEAGTVAGVLAAASGDPGVRIVYRLPHSDGYADATGRPVALPPRGPGVTSVLRDDQELAVVLHDPGTTDTDGIRLACGTALKLALDNERLRAEALSQLAELQASRARVVRVGDAERRELERNLHDGAQQRLLALSFDLRRAVASATDPHARDALVVAESESRAALAQLRELAHGIHPAVLEEAGLGAALTTLAESISLPVELRKVPVGRLPRDVEQAAYVIAREALAGAETNGAHRSDLGGHCCGRRGGRRGGGRRAGIDDPGRGQGRRRRRPDGVRLRRPSGGDPVRVVVGEDVLLVRAGVVRLLADAGCDVVAEADDLESVMRETHVHRPDVVVLDIRMPPTHTDEGLVAAARIGTELPGTGVLVLSSYLEPAFAMRLIDEHPGGAGYLLKERVSDIAVLVDALHRVAEGECVVDPTIVSRLVGRRRRTDPLDVLTDREREVLGLARRRALQQRSGGTNPRSPSAPSRRTPS